MSLLVTAKVLNTILPSSAKSILLPIGDFADDNGFAFPSIRTLSFKSSVKKTALLYHLKTLENLKLIKRTKRYADNSNKRHTSTAYLINIKELDKYTFEYKNLNKEDLAKLERKIIEVGNKYQKEYQDVRNYESEKRKRKSKSSQCEQPKLSEKSQCEQLNDSTCVNNLNHQSYIDEDELNKYFDEFYLYLNTIGIYATKSIEMHKNTIKVNLLKGHKFTMQNYKDFRSKNTA